MGLEALIDRIGENWVLVLVLALACASDARQISASGSLSGAVVFTITSWATLCCVCHPRHALEQAMPGHAAAHSPPASA